VFIICCAQQTIPIPIPFKSPSCRRLLLFFLRSPAATCQPNKSRHTSYGHLSSLQSSFTHTPTRPHTHPLQSASAPAPGLPTARRQLPSILSPSSSFSSNSRHTSATALCILNLRTLLFKTSVCTATVRHLSPLVCVAVSRQPRNDQASLNQPVPDPRPFYHG